MVREGDFDVMGEYVQCQNCGYIHKVKGFFNIEDLYIQEKCPKCRGETTHLLCGSEEDDLYLTYNLNMDPRYYNYNTK